MLKSLTIKNVALISSVKIDFTNGLNVLSGETGSGKSVILESLNFVLGAKSDKTLIKSGETECKVSAEFDVSDTANVETVFTELGLEYDENVIVSRTLDTNGKGAIRLNGEIVTASMLKKITSLLVDVHGQSEHYNLLKTSNQLKLIDNFGGNAIQSCKDKIGILVKEYKSVLSELEGFGGDESSRLMRLDILNYQIKEIIDCNLKDGEEAELLEIKGKLVNQDKIVNALSAVKSAFSEENGVNDILSITVKNASSVSEISPEYRALFDRIEAMRAESEDISETAADYLDGLEENEYSLDYVENRLDQIKNVKKKYGEDYNQITDFLERAKEEKEKLENFNTLAEKLLIKQDILKKDLYTQFNELSDLRRKYSKEFSERVLIELSSLGMNKATFSVVFCDKPCFENCDFDCEKGFDEISFSFSANAGEPLKPLSFVISGGEMSRFMLAIKAQSAKYNDISTFIFDEIDAGISGNVAHVVAKKFADISKNVQVIAITHLPQISAMADNNLLIIKTENDNKTKTEVKRLDDAGKIEEIARLVGGSIDNMSAVALSKDLIEKANEYKKSI